MARLVNESGVMGDGFVATAQNINSVSFDKIVEAIHTVQQQMSITGTTFDEAKKTISGSINMMGAAWTNWLTGLANEDADMGALTDQLLEAVSAVADNVGPRVLQIGQAIIQYLPMALSGLAQTLGPVLMDSLSQAWDIATTALPQMASSIVSGLAAMGPQLAQGLSQALSSAWAAASAALSGIGIQLPGLDASYFMALFQSLSDGFNQIMTAIGPPLQELINAVLPPLMSAIQGIIPLISAVVSTVLPPLISYITPIVSILANIAAAVIPALTAAINFLSPAIQMVITVVLTLMPVFSNLGAAISAVQGIMSGITTGVIPALQLAFSGLGPIIGHVSEFFGNLMAAIQLVAGAIGNVIGLIGRLAGAAAKIGGGIIGGIGKFLGFRTGGFTYGPAIAGEDPNYPTEAVISFNPAYRAQNIKYWQAAGHKLGAFSASRDSGGGSASVAAGGVKYDLSGMTFSPKVVVEGNASKEDIIAAIRECEGDFIDFVTDALGRRQEAAYAY